LLSKIWYSYSTNPGITICVQAQISHTISRMADTL
jgi:hypothetical protein